MSQHIGDVFQTGTSPPEMAEDPTRSRNLQLLERYLVVLEENKKACRAAVTDADMALDMAGFVKRQLRRPAQMPRMSPALLALALVRRIIDAPEQ